MIFDPISSPDPHSSAVVSHIVDEVTSVCGAEIQLERDQIEELARAVESFVQQETGKSAVDTRYLVMLTSQALSSLGEETAACRLLLFGSGMVKPAEWEVSGKAAMWVLDLKQITLLDGAPMEMLVFRSLNMIIEAIADLWDASEGSGVLGLRHVSRSAAALLGEFARHGELVGLGDEIKEVCREKLALVGQQRQWTAIPQVLDLDL